MVPPDSTWHARASTAACFPVTALMLLLLLLLCSSPPTDVLAMAQMAAYFRADTAPLGTSGGTGLGLAAAAAAAAGPPSAEGAAGTAAAAAAMAAVGGGGGGAGGGGGRGRELQRVLAAFAQVRQLAVVSGWRLAGC